MKNDAYFGNYPDQKAVNEWIASIWSEADFPCLHAELLETSGYPAHFGVNHLGENGRYIAFRRRGLETFYGYWQQAVNGPAPLLVHLPGYGAEMSSHPELVHLGFNVLHLSPMGYTGPDGFSPEKKRNGNWPVLPDTVISNAREGYRSWLLQAVLAVSWALGKESVLPGRVSFFGTSQGGGCALLLGSIFLDRGVRCVAADLPFLTNYPLASGRGAYRHAAEGIAAVEDKEAAWRALGFVDTLSHAFRLPVPVLLTAGGADDVCPPETIESLFSLLPGTKSYSFFRDLEHRYSSEFIHLVSSWFRLYA